MSKIGSPSEVNARGEDGIKLDGASTPSAQDEVKLDLGATPSASSRGIEAQTQHDKDAEMGKHIRLQREMNEVKRLDFSSTSSRPEADLSKWKEMEKAKFKMGQSKMGNKGKGIAWPIKNPPPKFCREKSKLFCEWIVAECEKSAYKERLLGGCVGEVDGVYQKPHPRTVYEFVYTNQAKAGMFDTLTHPEKTTVSDWRSWENKDKPRFRKL